MKLHCINCKILLAFYNSETKLYKLNRASFEKSSLGRFDYFFELPIKLHCRFHPEIILTYNKNNIANSKKIKCERCRNKTLGIINNNTRLGIEINFETVQKNIEFGNTIINCPNPKCKKLYNLEILRTKGVDIELMPQAILANSKKISGKEYDFLEYN